MQQNGGGMNKGNENFLRILMPFAIAAMIFISAPAHAQTALTREESLRIINGPCAQTRAIAAAVDFSVVGLSWPQKAAKFEAELPMDLSVADLKNRIAQSEESIELYYDDYAGKLDDYQLCLRQNKLSVALARANEPPTIREITASDIRLSMSFGEYSDGCLIARVGDVDSKFRNEGLNYDIDWRVKHTISIEVENQCAGAEYMAAQIYDDEHSPSNANGAFRRSSTARVFPINDWPDNVPYPEEVSFGFHSTVRAVSGPYAFPGRTVLTYEVIVDQKVSTAGVASPPIPEISAKLFSCPLRSMVGQTVMFIVNNDLDEARCYPLP